jgi:hypothetical protein
MERRQIFLEPVRSIISKMTTSRPLPRAQRVLDAALINAPEAFATIRSNPGVAGTNSYRMGFFDTTSPTVMWYITATALDTNDTAITLSWIRIGKTEGPIEPSNVWNFFLKILDRLSGC